jgi:hypothetical protein
MTKSKTLLLLPVAGAAAAAIAAGGATADSGVSAAGACTVNDAGLSYGSGGGGAGTLVEEFTYDKTGSGSCTLKGYPKVTLLKKSGAALPIKVKRSHARPVKSVTLRKGKDVVFELSHPSADPKTTKPCKIKVWGFRVHTPGFSKDLTLMLPNTPVRFCETGAKRTAFGRAR